MFTFEETEKIHKEIAIKGFQHPCFKGYVLYSLEDDAYVVKNEEVRGIHVTLFTHELFSAHVYDSFEEPFKIVSSRIMCEASPVHSAQLFEIKNKLFCHINS